MTNDNEIDNDSNENDVNNDDNKVTISLWYNIL